MFDTEEYEEEYEEEKYTEYEEQEYALELLRDGTNLLDSVLFAIDGCPVEPDGTCPHGYRSPLLILGII